MDRYNKLADFEKAALDKLYEYLGFNEIVSFERYLEYMFLNAKENITFANVFNHTIKNIVVAFWHDYPEYKNNYVKVFWVDPKQISKFTETGSKFDLDPRGLLRHYVKNNFRKLFTTKR